jgi:hypothetical protein
MLRSTLIVNGGTRRRPNSSLQSHFWCFVWEMHNFDGFIVIATHVTTLGRDFVASPTILYVGAMLRSTLIVNGGTRRRPNSSLQSHFWCFVWEMHNFDGYIDNATRVTTLGRD